VRDGAEFTKHFGIYQGQWLLGPDSRGNYLGMGDEHPVRHALKEWHEILIAGIKKVIGTTYSGIRVPLTDLLKLGRFDFDAYEMISPRCRADGLYEDKPHPGAAL
jgi:hypothetical protein